MQIKQEEANKIKATFYYYNKLKCHIKVRPIGYFDGTFETDLEEKLYYWFVTTDNKRMRLFLVDIHDIKDYEERVE